MPDKVWTLRRFFFSEYFADGVRTTLAVILPTLVFSLLGQLQVGIPLSMGALLVSLSDAPGPAKHKRNGMLWCVLLVLLVALISGYVWPHSWLMGLEILLFSFLFSMLAVYGNRAALIGSAALLAMILVMGLHPENVEEFSALIAVGGLWYLLLSLLFQRLLPYRPAQHALGECIRETATFLKLRGAFYNLNTDLEANFRKVVQQQVVVNEKQDAVRELLLRSRQLVKEATDQSRRLVLTFVDVVDLYEQVSAMQSDYQTLREQLAQTGLLGHFAQLIGHMGEELGEMGWAIQSRASYKPTYNLPEELAQLQELVRQSPAVGAQGQVLERILASMAQLLERFAHIRDYFGGPGSEAPELSQQEEYRRFVSHQEYDSGKILDNLTLHSAIFRHALRVAVACFIGFVLTKTVIDGNHSYWVLLTIIVILKPAFSLTKQRNYERLLGTIVGGVVGVAFLVLVEDGLLRFLALVVLMLGTFSLQRLNYVVSVIFMTPFILIVFSFLGGSGTLIAQERIVDTLIGSAIAFAASYTLFPNWESDKLHVLLQSILKANIQYLQKLSENLAGKEVASIEYKLARKEVYVSSANLSAAFQRMLSEPKGKQKNAEAIHRFLVLNHILSSNVAAVAALLQNNRQQQAVISLPEAVNKAVSLLQQSLRQLESDQLIHHKQDDTAPQTHPNEQAAPEPLLQDQLLFMQKVSQDIYKAAGAILA